jgi:hypothetical protein
VSHVRFCKDNTHRQQLADIEARLDALQGECNRLRNENEMLKKLVRPVAFVGDTGGSFEYEPAPRDEGWL